MALIDIFDVAATPIVAFLVARDICHLETLSKAWGDELRSLPSRDLWRNLFLKAFPAEASALLPLIVRGAPDADRRARVAYRNFATCGAAADTAIECAWMAGGPGQGPDEGRLPPKCHPRQADPFVLLLTAEVPESAFSHERRYAGIARWGTPEEFGRDSDTHALAPRLLFRASLLRSRRLLLGIRTPRRLGADGREISFPNSNLSRQHAA